MALLSSLMLIAATAAPARAQDLVYQWPEDEVVHYRIQSYLYAPRVLRFYAQENLDARVAEFTMGLLVKCKQVGAERKNIYVDCDIHRAEMGGQASLGAEQEKLTRIFQNYVSVLADATIQLTLTPTGRIKMVDLEGVDKGTSREAMVHDDLRMIIRRSMSAIEVELPKDGVDPGKPWKQKGAPLAMQLPTRYGTAGAVRMKNEIVGREGSEVYIHTEADALVSPATSTSTSSQETGSSTSTTMKVSMIADGKSTFDTEKHLITKGEMTVQGTLTASSSGVGDGEYLKQFVLIDMLDNFDQLDAEFEAMLAGDMEEPGADDAASQDAKAAEDAAKEALRERTEPREDAADE